MPILTSAERIGTVIAKRYRVLGVLAHGGMGVVFDAQRVSDALPVALKLPRAELSPDQTKAARLEVEAKIATRFSHPHVVAVLDSGLTEDGLPFVVFERLYGLTLAQAITQDGPLSPTLALHYLLPIAGALSIVHEKGIVHRDIKPQNIFLHQVQDMPPVCKLLDFGLAKLGGESTLTRTGTAMGTPAYMAPEQRAGQRTLSARADVWSLSAVMHCCLTGTPPHDETGDALDPLSSWPALQAAIQRGLRSEPSRRYASIREWAQAMGNAALKDEIELPSDPDPLGLPWWPSWLSQAVFESTASQAVPHQTRSTFAVNWPLAGALVLIALSGFALHLVLRGGDAEPTFTNHSAASTPSPTAQPNTQSEVSATSGTLIASQPLPMELQPRSQQVARAMDAGAKLEGMGQSPSPKPRSASRAPVAAPRRTAEVVREEVEKPIRGDFGNSPSFKSTW